MAWTTTLTADGIALLNGATAGNKLDYTSVYVRFLGGTNGTDSCDMPAEAFTVTLQDNTTVIRAQISNSGIETFCASGSPVITLPGTNPMTKITKFIVRAKLHSDTGSSKEFCTCTADSSDYIQVSHSSSGTYMLLMDIPVAVSATDSVTVISSGGYALATELAALRTRVDALVGEAVAEIVPVPDITAQIAALAARVAALETKYDETAPGGNPVEVEPPDNGT